MINTSAQANPPTDPNRPPQEIHNNSVAAGRVPVDPGGPYGAVAAWLSQDIFTTLGRFPISARCARRGLCAPVCAALHHCPEFPLERHPKKSPKPKPLCKNISAFAGRFVRMAVSPRPPALYLDGRWWLVAYVNGRLAPRWLVDLAAHFYFGCHKLTSW
jgi:hypothetical protein